MRRMTDTSNYDGQPAGLTTVTSLFVFFFALFFMLFFHLQYRRQWAGFFVLIIRELSAFLRILATYPLCPKRGTPSEAAESKIYVRAI